MKSRSLLLATTLLSTAGFAFAQNPVANADSSPGDTMAMMRMLNNIFFPLDTTFPTPVAASNNQLNTVASSSAIASQWTRNSVNLQLQTLPNTITRAYNRLQPGSWFTSTANPDQVQNQISALTAGRPSFDTFFLPNNVLCMPSDGGCAHKQSDGVLQQNANGFNFDAFFSPPSLNSGDNGSNAQTYIAYALQTYQPMINQSAPSAGNDSQNQSFFQLLNDRLQNDSKHANSFLMQNVINNPQFQQYWADLRSLEAKNSILLSNLNFLAAERTPQKGLGAAYGLKDTQGNAINDASAMQVEQALVNNTVYNPDWYKQMKTAPLATLQRQQLLLTSLLVRLQYHNEMINERNLATQLILANNVLQQSKLQLQQEESQLKTAIFPESNTPSTPGATATP